MINYSKLKEHEDNVRRMELIDMINQGVRCEYSYTHYFFDKNKRLDYRDERRQLTKEEALSFMSEKNVKKNDGFRFSPSRCFLYGYVRALREGFEPDAKCFILFSEADRKPTVEERFAVYDGTATPEEILAKNHAKS